MDRTGTSAPFWAREQLGLRRVLASWVEDEIARDGAIGFARKFEGLSHHRLDEAGGVIRAWFGYYWLSGDRQLFDYAKDLRDAWCEATSDHFHHGYQSNASGDYVKHTSEAFSQFLLNVFYLDVGDLDSIARIEDAAEHLGNWSPDVYDWYDWNEHRFLSYFPGTRNPDYFRAPFNWEGVIHFRLLQIAVGAYDATHNARYLDLLTDYAGKWAKEILDAPSDGDIPHLINHFSEAEWHAFSAQDRYREDWHFVNYWPTYRAKHLLKDAGTPWFLHDIVMTMLDIYRHAPKLDFYYALQRLMRYWVENDIISPTQLAAEVPHCGYHLLKYRDFTGDTSLDGSFLSRFAEGPTAYLLTGEVKRFLGYPSSAAGVYRQTLRRNGGKAGSPLVVTHGCDLHSNPGGACAYVMPSLYLPVFGGMTAHYGRAPWVNVLYYADGVLGLPADVAALYVPSVDGRPASVRLYNAGRASRRVTVRRVRPGTAEDVVAETIPGAAKTVEVTLRPGRGERVEFA